MAKQFTAEEIKSLISHDNVREFYHSKAWEQLSNEVKREQNYECQLCKLGGKAVKGKLVHHVRELKQYPELAYSKYYTDEQGREHRQLVCLCHDCHERIHGKGKYYDRTKHFSKNKFTNKEKW